MKKNGREPRVRPLVGVRVPGEFDIALGTVAQMRHPMCPPAGHKKRTRGGFNRSNRMKFERLAKQGHPTAT